MRFKTRPDDFIVDEIIDEDRLRGRDEGLKFKFHWFRLFKRETEQIAAVEEVASLFNVPVKYVHIAGMKDRMGITSQNIAVYGISETEAAVGIKELGRSNSRIHLESRGEIRARVESADLIGNRFALVLRDGSREEAQEIHRSAGELAGRGCLNRFDDQRFGYARNSHRIGLLMIKNDLSGAVQEVLTSLPDRPRSELKPDMVAFHDFIAEGFSRASMTGDRDFYSRARSIAPGFLKNEIRILDHLSRQPRDFSGAFRSLPRKLRFLFLSAYQSDVFNRLLEVFRDSILAGGTAELPLIAPDLSVGDSVRNAVDEILKEDGIRIEDLKLGHLPEFGLRSVMRPTRILPRALEIDEPSPDEIFPGRWKLSLRFILGPGEYATTVLKDLMGS